MSYFLWGCRGNLILITLRSERVNNFKNRVGRERGKEGVWSGWRRSLQNRRFWWVPHTHPIFSAAIILVRTNWGDWDEWNGGGGREGRAKYPPPPPPFPFSSQSTPWVALLYSSQAFSVPQSKMAAGIQRVLTNTPALQAMLPSEGKGAAPGGGMVPWRGAFEAAERTRRVSSEWAPLHPRYQTAAEPWWGPLGCPRERWMRTDETWMNE